MFQLLIRVHFVLWGRRLHGGRYIEPRLPVGCAHRLRKFFSFDGRPRGQAPLPLGPTMRSASGLIKDLPPLFEAVQNHDWETAWNLVGEMSGEELCQALPPGHAMEGYTVLHLLAAQRPRATEQVP